eukprot:TRINITY_DN8345_c0_g1_i1.p1 TRINITY_DN8345_c0_g1~~TRINITY_DN8345_c0_g1_i1.p1  ORF type:complete len:386 (-),score=71.31 TRINITY_DN8345_c0_g1_i1:360-1457(-)
MCIRDRVSTQSTWGKQKNTKPKQKPKGKQITNSKPRRQDSSQGESHVDMAQSKELIISNEEFTKDLKYSDLIIPANKEDLKPLSFFTRIGLTQPCLHSRTEFCQHHHGCLENILAGTLRTFVLCYLVRIGISLISVVLQIRKGKEKAGILLLSALLRKGNAKFACFPSAFNFILKASLCMLRRILKRDDGLTAFSAGALAGSLSLFFQKKQNRKSWGTYLIARALECAYNSAVTKGKIKASPFHGFWVFSICNTVLISLGKGLAPYLIGRGLVKFYDQLSGPSSSELAVQKVWMDMGIDLCGFDRTRIKELFGYDSVAVLKELDKYIEGKKQICKGIRNGLDGRGVFIFSLKSWIIIVILYNVCS